METTVIEYQTIIKRDEFLHASLRNCANYSCYVVLVKYRRWDLPQNELISLLHKYCITYESKTKCKLLVSEGVDLIKVPRIVRGKSPLSEAYIPAFVKRASQDSIEDTARRVVAEVESQVNVLGRGSDIQRAINIYGRIGDVFNVQKTKTGFVSD